MNIKRLACTGFIWLSLCGFQVLHLENNNKTLQRALKQDTVLKKMSLLEDNQYAKEMIQMGLFGYAKTIGLSPSSPALTFYTIDSGVHIGNLYVVAYDMTFFKKLPTGSVVDVLDKAVLPYLGQNQIGVITNSGGSGLHATFVEIMSWDSRDLLANASYPISGYVQVIGKNDGSNWLSYESLIKGYDKQNIKLEIKYSFGNAPGKIGKIHKLHVDINSKTGKYRLISGSKEVFEFVRWTFDFYKQHA